MNFKFDKKGNLLSGIYIAQEDTFETFLFSTRRISLCYNFNLLILEVLKKLTHDPFFIVFFGSFVNNQNESPSDIDIEVFLSNKDLTNLTEDIYFTLKDSYYEKYNIDVIDITSYQTLDFNDYFNSQQEELWSVNKLSDNKKGVVIIWF